MAWPNHTLRGHVDDRRVSTCRSGNSLSNSTLVSLLLSFSLPCTARNIATPSPNALIVLADLSEDTHGITIRITTVHTITRIQESKRCTMKQMKPAYLAISRISHSFEDLKELLNGNPLGVLVDPASLNEGPHSIGQTASNKPWVKRPRWSESSLHIE